jgi:hypothetical protein
MGIRIQHSKPSTIAKLGLMASESRKSERDAARAEQNAMMLRQIQANTDIANKRIEVQKQMQVDNLEFKREALHIQNKFDLEKQLIREKHDFDLIEKKRIQTIQEDEAAIKAINDSMELSKEEKDKLTVIYRMNKSRGGQGVAGLLLSQPKITQDKTALDRNRLISGIKNMEAQLQKKIDFVGQFKKESAAGLMPWTWGTKKITRTAGKNKKTASPVEIEEYNNAIKDIPTYRKQLNQLKESLNNTFDNNNKIDSTDVNTRSQANPAIQAQQDVNSVARAKEIALTTPKSIEEATVLLQEMAKLNPKAAQALNEQWAKLNLRSKQNTQSIPAMLERKMGNPSSADVLGNGYGM